MINAIPLTKLEIGSTAKIDSINCTNSIKRRLLDLGLVPDTYITPIFKSTGGDPIAYEIRNTILAIRNQDAQNILILVN